MPLCKGKPFIVSNEILNFIFVQPPRAKHCKELNRCVKRFDHYCAYVGSAIGYHNQHYFYIFLFSMTATMWIGQWMCYHVQKEETKRDWWMIFMQTISSVFNLLTTLLLGKKRLHLLIHES